MKKIQKRLGADSIMSKQIFLFTHHLTTPISKNKQLIKTREQSNKMGQAIWEILYLPKFEDLHTVIK